MARPRSISHRYLVLLALVCVTLVGVLLVQLAGEEGSGDIADRPASGRPPEEVGQQDESPDGFVMPPWETYSEVAERPLFLRSRRPAPPQVETAEETPAKTSPAIFVLSGVVLTDTQRLALLQGQNSPKVAHVEEGHEYEGWTVESIHPHKVVMRRGQEISEILLEDKNRRPPTEAKRRVRQRNQPTTPENQEKKNEEKSKDDVKKD